MQELGGKAAQHVFFACLSVFAQRSAAGWTSFQVPRTIFLSCTATLNPSPSKASWTVLLKNVRAIPHTSQHRTSENQKFSVICKTARAHSVLSADLRRKLPAQGCVVS